MMTLLQLVQRHCRRTGITVPQVVASSTEDQILMCLELLNEELDELTQRHPFAALSSEATWITAAGGDQGTLQSLAPGLVNDWIIQDTFYDRTGNIKFTGPLTAQQYAAQKAMSVSGITHTWRVLGGHLFVDDDLPVGSTLAFEYITNRAVLSSSNNHQQYFSADDDTPLLSDTVLLAGLRWRWKREQGLAYDEDFRRYEGMVENFAGRNGGKPILDAGGGGDFSGGIVIPVGNWPL